MQRYPEELAETEQGLNRLNPPRRSCRNAPLTSTQWRRSTNSPSSVQGTGGSALIGFEDPPALLDKHTAYTDGGKAPGSSPGKRCEGVGLRRHLRDDDHLQRRVKPGGSTSVFDVGKLTDVKV